MKTNFKILWIDDQREENGADLLRKKTNIEHDLKTECFEVVIDTKSSFSMDEINSGLAEYDLILVDFDLKDDDIGGLQIIEGLRDADIFSEILFYSQSYEVDIEVLEFCYKKSKFLEGVFVCHRGDEAFKEKFKQIINILINKTNNLNTMRGLVLAETADLDYILCEIIDNLCSQNAILKTQHPLRDSSDQKYLCPDASTTERFIKWMQGKNGGSNSNFIHHLTKTSVRSLSKYTTTIHQNLNDYRVFYDVKRNNLAHGKTEVDTRGIMHANGVHYSVKDLKDMRKVLIEFRECFEEFRDSI